jgi:MFS transporter, YNFM family, putative membrane transport protein
MTIPDAAPGASPSSPSPLIVRGKRPFWRINAAMFIAGLGTFALLYCVQPLMPDLARTFSLSPAGASLSLSAATGVMAVAMFGAGALSERFGRKRVMTLSLASAAGATVAAAFAPNWAALVALRALTGLALSGVPAVAMAHLAEEVERSDVGLAMGLYIAGSTLGGMGGRLSVAAMAEHGGWRAAVGAIGVFSLLGAALFALALPRERRTEPGAAPTDILPAIRLHLADPGLRSLFTLGFLLMGGFVTIYNYVGFRLSAPPFSLGQTTIGFVFVLYLVGAVVSPIVGELSGRFGRRKVIGFAIALVPLGVLATLPDNLPMIVLGIALVTAGFFGGHSIASSWVGLRAEKARAQASALYLFFYYLGSSVAGSAGGVAFARGGWHGVAAFVGVLAGLAFLVALRLSRVPPPAHMLR